MITATAALAALVYITWRVDRVLRRFDLHVSALSLQLDESRRAHEHQLAELHRRLDGIEAAAGRAETEARAVSELLGKYGDRGSPSVKATDGGASDER